MTRPLSSLLASAVALCFACVPAAAEVRKVLLIGVDSAEWRVVDPLIRAGALPNLARIVRSGCSATLRSDDSPISPLAWTTIVTGKRPAQHGILGFTPEGVPPSTDRRVKAIWEILSEHGSRVLVAFMLGSQPVGPLNGVIIAKEFFSEAPDRLGTTLYPLDAFGEYPLRLVRAIFVKGKSPFQGDPFAPSYGEQALADIQVHLVSDGMSNDDKAVAGAEFLLERGDFDFFSIHLWGLDGVQHGFIDAPRASPRRGGKASPMRPGDVVPAYYRHVDRLIGRLSRFAGPNAVVAVVSDHGMEALPQGLSRRGGAWAQRGGHGEVAMLALSGKPVRRCRERLAATLYDITPTILYLAGLPIGRDMAGRPIRDAIAPKFLAENPIRTVATYETVRSSSPARAPATPDAETLRLLRNLGYIR